MTPDEDIRDAALFRLWIRLGSEQPSRVANKLTWCKTVEQYRAALMELAQEERINLP